MPSHRYALILAGGSGTRLWPMSRAARPKQLLPLIQGRTLLHLAADRVAQVVPTDSVLVCAAEQYRASVRATLPGLRDEQFLGEPVGRDTVNAIGLGAAVLARRDRDAVFTALASDHLIEPVDAFRQRLEVGFQIVEQEPTRLVALSIAPTYPATSYGYIERGQPLAGFADAYRVARFVEKPDEARAKQFIASGAFSWNCSIFVFHAATFLQALQWFAPQTHEGLMKIAAAWDGPQRQNMLREVYPTLPKISVDFAVMEKAASDQRIEVCTVLLNLNWIDVGSWNAFAQTLPADRHGNRTNVHDPARAELVDCRHVVVVSDDPTHTIATIGCEDLIIVHTKDATLVCPAAMAERVKELSSRVDQHLR